MLRLTSIRHRPKQGIIVFRIDVVVDRDDPAPCIPVPGRRSIESAPDFSLWRIAGKLDNKHSKDRRQRLMHVNATNSLHTNVFKMTEQFRLHCRAADRARFTWCNLADD